MVLFLVLTVVHCKLQQDCSTRSLSQPTQIRFIVMHFRVEDSLSKMSQKEALEFSKLPSEVWHSQVWRFLPVVDLFCHVRLVCREWNNMLIRDGRSIALEIDFSQPQQLQSFYECWEKSIFDNNVQSLTIHHFESLPLFNKEESANDHWVDYQKMDSIETFCPFEYFPNLTHLKCQKMTLRVCRKLLQQVIRMDRLTWLDLSNNIITPVALSHLLGCLPFENLVKLDLSFNYFEDISILSQFPFQRLQNLILNGIKFTHDSVLLLCSSPHLENLTELGLSNCFLNSRTARCIFSSFKQLTSLDISGNFLGCVGIKNIPVQSSHLQKLNLQKTLMNNDAIQVLASNPYFENITWLDLSRNKINKIGCSYLAQSPYLSQVKYLDLSKCGIGKEGVSFITNSTHLKLVTFIE